METITELRNRDALRAHVRQSLVPSHVEPIKCGLPACNDELSEEDVEQEVQRIEREAARAHANSAETRAWQAERRDPNGWPR
jgi:hypothetical protein